MSPKLTLIRVGDFYEAFDGDAKTVSSVLDIALTTRGGRPMCGIPVHSAGSYVAALEGAGYGVDMVGAK